MATTTVAPHAEIFNELPLVGSLNEFRKDQLGFLSRLVRTQGNVARFHFGPFPVVLFNEPELVHELLLTHADDFDKGFVLRNAIKPFSGNGIFLSEGEFHDRQRKLMSPAFRPRQIAGYADTMAQFAEQ